MADSAISVADRVFVSRLQREGLFELAIRYCEQRAGAGSDADGRAAWELLIAESYRQQSWSLRATGRRGLLHHAAERITRFSGDVVISPQLELLLRARQIELLTESVLAEVRIAETGRHFRLMESIRGGSAELPAMAGAVSGDTLASGLRIPESDGLRATLETARSLVEALLVQLESIRREMDPAEVRHVRDCAHCLQAQVVLLQSQLALTEDVHQELQRDALQMILLTRRSAADDAPRLQAELLGAQLELQRRDTAAADFRLTHLEQLAQDDDERAAVEAIRIELLLIQGEPTRALARLLPSQRPPEQMTQQLELQKLECLLAMYELTHYLGEPDAREQAARQFLEMADAVSGRVAGVWHDAADQLIARFRRIRQVGSGAADALERIELLAAEGDIAGAVTGIDALIAALPPSTPATAIASLHLTAGDYLIRRDDWPAAEQHLRQAGEIYQGQHLSERAAAADLLQIYALGRRMQAASAGASRSASALLADYRAVLERHLRDYADQPTATTAREWYVLLLKDSDPGLAASESMKLAERALLPEAREWALVQAGALLLADLDSDDVGSTAPQATMRQFLDQTHDIPALFQEYLEAEAGEPIGDNWMIPTLEMQRELLQIRMADPQDIDWNSRGAVIEQLRGGMQRLASRPLSAAAATQAAAASAELAVIEVVSGCRLLRGRDDLQQPMQTLRGATVREQQRFAGVMVRFLGPGPKVQPGETQLAGCILDLLEQSLQSAATSDERIRLLATVAPAAQALGNPLPVEQLLTPILSSPLDGHPMDDIAAILLQYPALAGAAAGEGVVSVWSRILRRAEKGSSAWLEASLQLAEHALSTGNTAEAERILRVVAALYPDWGAPHRKARADALTDQIRSRK